MSYSVKFLHDVDEFLAVHGMSPTKFGLIVMNDGKFLSDVRKGRNILSSTEEKVRLFMRNYTPENTQRSAS